MMDNALKYAKECRNKMNDKNKSEIKDTNKKIKDIVNREKIERLKKATTSIIQNHSAKKIDLTSLKSRISIIEDKTKAFIAKNILKKFDERDDLKKRFKNRAKFIGKLGKIYNEVS